MSLRTNKQRAAVLLSAGLVAVVTVSIFSPGSQGGPRPRPARATMKSPRPACPAEHKPPRGTDRFLQFTQDNQLVRPTGYRKWIYAGTPVTPNDMNDGAAAFPEFHSVYIDPVSYAVYEKTGEFPDGTIMVKELAGVGAKSATSGNGYFMGEFTGLEVSLKDSQRFADEPGHWAFFSFGHEYPLKDRAAAHPAANCNDCHGSAAGQDYVFTQYLPVIRAARPKPRTE